MVPVVDAQLSEEGFYLWPTPKIEEETLKIFDQAYGAGAAFVGEVTMRGSSYMVFKKPVMKRARGGC